MTIINSDIYFIKISEFEDWYIKWKVNLTPSYQRKYKWNISQKTKLIESIIKWIPLPSLFVFHNTSTNSYEIIDWLQRLSTIFEFCWCLPDKEILITKNKISLSWLIEWDEIDYLKWLKNIKSLDIRIQNKIKNYKLSAIIIEDPEEKEKVMMFKRLNSYWITLNPQEKINNELLLKSTSFYLSLEQLAEKLQKINFFNITPTQKSDYKDYEYIIRYFLISKYLKWSITWKDKHWIYLNLIKNINEWDIIPEVIYDYFIKAKEIYPSFWKKPYIWDFLMRGIFNNYFLIDITLHKTKIVNYIETTFLKNPIIASTKGNQNSKMSFSFKNSDDIFISLLS